MAADRDRDRDRWSRRDRREREDRGFWERAGDQVRSWFDDDDEQERYAGPRGVRRGRERSGGYRDDVGYATEVGSRRRGWDVDDSGYERDRFEDDDRYGDYGRMARSGYGWAGTGGSDWSTERQGAGRRGEGYGPASSERYRPAEGERYGPAGSERYGPAAGERHGPGSSRRYGAAGEDRYSTPWGASDWQEQAARRERDYAGVGPAGYKRSAERITEDVNEALTWDPYIDASRIEVRVEGDEVILEGAVDSREAKRAAEAVAERVRGVRDVHNRLRVEPRQGASIRGDAGRSGTSLAAAASSLPAQGATAGSQQGRSPTGQTSAVDTTAGRAAPAGSTTGQSSSGQSSAGLDRTGERGSED